MAFQPALYVGLLLLVVALLVLRRGIQTARTMRAVRSLQARPVADLEPGLALTRGTLATASPLESPFQKRACVYYFFRVVEPRGAGRVRDLARGKEWTTATVEDETGRAHIEPVTPMVASPRRHETGFYRLQRIPSELVGFFERAGIEERHLARLPQFYVYEYTLEPGDEVSVTGTVRVANGEKTFYRAKRQPLIVASEPDVGYVRGLRNELLLYATVGPLLTAAGFALVGLAFA